MITNSTGLHLELYWVIMEFCLKSLVLEWAAKKVKEVSKKEAIQISDNGWKYTSSTIERYKNNSSALLRRQIESLPSIIGHIAFG
ncbi:unnamed protein product [Blepharisma stoltei]|uniref:Transposase n=1 Tax=Blepharisma stoltei TaxID=1481888 RepID=A0AAU9KCB5_9CILI|nr:unnamed protein product [Blepharisma stoltei]